MSGHWNEEQAKRRRAEREGRGCRNVGKQEKGERGTGRVRKEDKGDGGNEQASGSERECVSEYVCERE